MGNTRPLTRAPASGMIDCLTRDHPMSPVVLTLTLTLAAPGPKDKKDVSPLVGEWSAESATSQGKQDNPPPGTTFTFTADGKSIVKVGGKEPVEGTYKTDAKKDPAEVTISPGIKKRSNMHGIFKVEGDTLTLSLADDSEERPKVFESPVGAKSIVITLKRLSKKD